MGAGAVQQCSECSSAAAPLAVQPASPSSSALSSFTLHIHTSNSPTSILINPLRDPYAPLQPADRRQRRPTAEKRRTRLAPVCPLRPAPMADGGEEGGGGREQDRLLPVANISRIMKKVLPANAKIAKDAKEAIQECTSEFISFITSE